MTIPALTAAKSKRIDPKKQRKLVEDAIDRLLDLLDDIDSDPDAEPSLGWPDSGDNVPQSPSAGYDAGDDREGYCVSGVYSRLHEGDDEPHVDDEASLGWPNPETRTTRGCDQTRLYGEVCDGENEPELGWSNAEARLGIYGYDARRGLDDDQSDGEASLGWQNEGSQACLIEGTNDDREQQCEDEGWDCGLAPRHRGFHLSQRRRRRAAKSTG